MSALVPCPSCSRHVRASEDACPFCKGELPANLATRAVPAARGRLDRLATFTFAAALAVAGATGTTACSGGSTVDQQEESSDEGALRHKKDAGPAKKDAGCRDPGAIVAMYGMPPVPDDRPFCEEDGGGFVAMYGGPVVVDDGGGFHAMYGMPRFDAGSPDEDEDAGSMHAMYGLPPHH